MRTEANTGVDHYNSVKDIEELSKKKYREAIKLPIHLINLEIKLANKHLEKTQKKAGSLRQKFFDELIEKVATRKALSTKEVTKAVKEYKKLQQSRKKFSKIRETTKPFDGTPLNKVQIGSDSEHLNPKTGKRCKVSSSVFIDSQKELERAIID